jgi:site-specific recombinase XerD
LEWQKLTRDRFRSPPFATVLREHRKRALADGLDRGDRFVFSTRRGTPISHRNAAAPSRDATTAAGLQRVGFHVLRHGFASTLIVELRLDPVQVSR